MTLLRLLIGALFVGHGLQKLRGWFGGVGLEKTAQGFDSMGLRPPVGQAVAAGVTETTAGLLFLSGFLTPLAASMVTGVMAVATHKVHLKNGVWITKGGFEYNAVLMASAFALAAEGPGAVSLDHRLGLNCTGLPWAVAELSLGVAGAVAVERLASAWGEDASVTDEAPPPEKSGEGEQPHLVDLRGSSGPAEAGPVIAKPHVVSGTHN